MITLTQTENVDGKKLKRVTILGYEVYAISRKAAQKLFEEKVGIISEVKAKNKQESEGK